MNLFVLWLINAIFAILIGKVVFDDSLIAYTSWILLNQMQIMNRLDEK
jgi:hypothetical protein